MSETYDLFVIGAGSAGVRSSRLAAATGAKVAIAEELRVGGTCVLRGCVPKKLLVIGSHFADDFEDARAYGWDLHGQPTHDWKALIEAKNKELDRLHQIYLGILERNKVEVVNGRASVAGPNEVSINGKTIKAKNILVATGGWPSLPQIPGIEHAITSNEALELKERPGHIAIVGGGFIAVEFAGIFAAMGSRVTQITRADKVLRGFDQDVRDMLQEEMTKKGVAFHCSQHVTSIAKRADGGLDLTLEDGSGIACDQVLYATGRHPNTKGLGLEEAGVELDWDGAVKVDAYSQSSVPSIHAIGDVTNRVQLTPVAIAEAHCLIDTLFKGHKRAMDYQNIPLAVFSQPPVSTVGLTEAEAQKKFGALDIYLTRFRSLRHTLTGRDEKTMMKLVVKQSDQKV
ncbi:MAG TPA: glutathione-disulfide reductase, partial [Magnetospirillaceae bacterium]|nr:glutathione-disulfide reductase [Magnetospirillaceae bacterium]